MLRADKYASIAELKRREPRRAWRIQMTPQDSTVLIIAPHGGAIEPGTSDIAARIAGQTYNLYCFEGRKARGQNQTLHVTSARFDEDGALKLAGKCGVVLGIHGCRGRGRRAIYVGGRDTPLREALAAALAATGVEVRAYGHTFRATNPLNICNRGRRRRGAQLEITLDLRRSSEWRQRIAVIARAVLERYVQQLGPKIFFKNSNGK
jgi:phage replication-related protein YjqB (UPF0714/DUF867 family)